MIKTKKLSLSRETVRQIDLDNLASHGAAAATATDNCPKPKCVTLYIPSCDANDTDICPA